MPGLMLAFALVTPSEGMPSHADLPRRGEDAYQAGLDQRAQADPADRGEAHFRQAAEAWEELRREGIDNAALYRNLGHAYFLAGDLPRAILNYRLGLRRAPRDGNLRDSLRQARKLVIFADGGKLGRPAEEPAVRWLVEPGSVWLFGMAVAAYLMGWLAVMRWFMVHQPRWLLIGGLLVGLGIWPGWLVFERQQSGPPPAIVVIAREDVLLRKGDGALFPAWSDTPLGRGVEAEQILARDGWLLVRLGGGEVGWVRSVEVVVGDDPEAFR